VEDVKILEAKPDLSLEVGDKEPGILVIKLQYAHREHLEKLRAVVKKNPGDYRCIIQVGDPNSFLPIDLITRVNAEDTTIREIEQTVRNSRVELILSKHVTVIQE